MSWSSSVTAQFFVAVDLPVAKRKGKEEKYYRKLKSPDMAVS